MLLFRSLWLFLQSGQLQPMALAYDADVPAMAEGIGGALLVLARAQAR